MLYKKEDILNNGILDNLPNYKIFTLKAPSTPFTSYLNNVLDNKSDILTKEMEINEKEIKGVNDKEYSNSILKGVSDNSSKIKG
ncbi:hypothetical protein CWI39_1861p0020, partial [Hamiltosporidium magnivora]